MDRGIDVDGHGYIRMDAWIGKSGDKGTDGFLHTNGRMTTEGYRQINTDGLLTERWMDMDRQPEDR